MTLANPPAKTRTIALAGNPNSGKTTLFNALTGLRQKTGNYPGVTVEKRVGRIKATTNANGESTQIDVIDLPGTYSLISGSPDERVAVDVLCGHIPGTTKPDLVVVVVDASNLQRNLYLVSQLIEMRLPMVIALNMTDIAERRGQRVSAELLAKHIGVPVIPIVAHKGKGVDRLKAAFDQAAVPIEPAWPLPEVFRAAVAELTPSVQSFAGQASLSPAALAERLLVGEYVSVKLPPDVGQAIEAKRALLHAAGIDPMQADVEAHYRWIEDLSQRVTSPTVDLRVRGVPRENKPAGHAVAEGATLAYIPTTPLTERADRILLHKVWGLLAFAVIMASVFMAIFFAAAPLMDWAQNGVSWIGEKVADRMSDGTLKDLWTDGIVAGVGGVIVFVPQIAILFGLLAILEDSGYLARAAFLMDRLLAKVGLSGRAFVPLLSGFACAIPGVMATRTIASPRDRLRTIFVLPFMSCSARLPVYALLIGAFFASQAWWIQGSIMLGLYLLGIAAAFITAWVWKSRSREAVSSFILELPIYKVPQISTVLRVVWQNTWAFVSRAGTIIFALSVILWALTYWPRLPEEKAEEVSHLSKVDYHAAKQQAINAGCLTGFTDSDEAIAARAVASEQLRYSFAGRFGHLIEPAIKPLGFDWKMGVGMVGAFGAREVFVSTMGIVYAAGSDDENVQPLEDAMKADKYADGKPVWRPLVAITMLIWFVLAMQCLSTVAIVRRETGTWKWPLLQILYMNGLAYTVCLIVYQIGRALGA